MRVPKRGRHLSPHPQSPQGIRALLWEVQSQWQRHAGTSVPFLLLSDLFLTCCFVY